MAGKSGADVKTLQSENNTAKQALLVSTVLYFSQSNNVRMSPLQATFTFEWENLMVAYPLVLKSAVPFSFFSTQAEVAFVATKSNFIVFYNFCPLTIIHRILKS